MKIIPPTSNPRSRRRIKIIVAALITISVAGLAWLLRPVPEPIYNGKPLTLWLEEYSRGNRSEDHQKAMETLGKMGTNAIPIIVRTLEQNDSPLINRYREGWAKLPTFGKKLLPKPKFETFWVHNAAAAFYALSPTNVVPQLPGLARARNPAVREAAFTYIARLPDLFLPKDDLLSLCQPALTDSSPLVRQYSARALANVGPAGSNAIPELLVSLQGRMKGRRNDWIDFSRYSTAKALGKIGTPAAIAFPALLNQLNNRSNDTVTLIAVTNALKTIDPEAAAKAGVK